MLVHQLERVNRGRLKGIISDTEAATVPLQIVYLDFANKGKTITVGNKDVPSVPLGNRD